MDTVKVIESLRDMLNGVFSDSKPTSGFHQRVIDRARADIKKAIAGLEDGSITAEELFALAILQSFILGAQSLESAEVMK